MSRVLFEIGTEAIPAGYMPPALRELQDRAERGLDELRLSRDSVAVRGTPNRLVLEIHGLAGRQEDVERTVQGPRVEVAFKDGEPTGAAQGFARKNGVEVSDLQQEETDKGAVVVAHVRDVGQDADQVLPEFLSGLALSLPWPKTMRWDASGFLFPRPVRWVVALRDSEVLPVRLGDLEAGRITRGHRLLGPGERELKDASALQATLRERGVVLDPADRLETIREGLAAEATRLGGRPVPDEGLLEEVVHLAEHPCVLSGSFDPDYLAIPREIVVTAMRSHQRYFAVEDASGTLLPHFLVVCDGRWDDPSEVITGNERVLRARLADARFYWDVDQKTGLDALAESLSSVVWLEAVGTVKDKSDRVARLVERFGPDIAGDDWSGLKTGVLRAAKLAKADLASEMIKDGKEFTGLQGVMGARYAAAAGEDDVVVRTLSEQYLPRGASDPLPESTGGLLLGLADRLDTIAGCWAAGFVPSGSQDPYALRRAGNGIVRLCLEKNLRLDLSPLVVETVAGLPESVRTETLASDVETFLRERIAYHLKESGISYDTVDAVMAAGSADPVDARARAAALQAVRGEADLEKLVVGFKRTANILKKSDAVLPDAASLDWSSAEAAERGLHEAVLAAAKATESAAAAGDYSSMVAALLALRAPIDSFFDQVMVMADDPAVRERRLALLTEVRGLFAGLADLSRIVLEGDAS